MHPRIREVLANLDTHRAALERAVKAVPAELRERRPASDRWSVAEVLDHLALLEGQITGVLKGLIDSAQASGLGADLETSSVVATLDVTPILDRSRPAAADDASQPRAGVSVGEAMAALVRQREELRTVMLSADGLALTEVSTPFPGLGPLNVYQWVLVLGAHEARHTAQIQEIAAALSIVPTPISLA